MSLPAPPLAAADRPPLLAGDHPAMHLLNSRATPDGRAVEWIGNGEALRRWLLASAVGTDEAAAATPSALDAAALAARRFREWFRDFVTEHAGRPLSASVIEELAPLNDLLREDSIHRSVIITGGKPAWTFDRRQGGARALLQPLAVAAGDLVCVAEFTRVRRCAGPGCSIWFLDRTKGGKRRWCSMAVCGNRAKASTHRHRKRGAVRPDE